MRVLQVMGSARPGGAEAFFARLCVGLSERGLDQRLAIRRDADCLPTLRAGGLQAVELPFVTSFDPVTHRELGRLISGYEPHVVMTWMNRATVLCPKGRFTHVARMGGYYTLKYYKRCDHLIGNTQSIVDYCRRNGWPVERTHYLPNFADEAPCDPVSRESLGAAPDSRVVLALGRLHDDKAFDVLLKAMVKVPAAELWIAGEGPEDAALRAQSAELGLADRVSFLGWRTDAGALLEAADCLVCPSRIEPLGNVVLEAWTHGAPVVAARSSGPAGLIEDGRTGLLVAMEDDEGLAHALNAVLDDPALAARLGEGGRSHYRRSFSRDAVLTRYMGFFETVGGACAA